jgi:hypothetical protein
MDPKLMGNVCKCGHPMVNHLIITTKTCSRCKKCKGYDPVDPDKKDTIEDLLSRACELAGVPRTKNLSAASMITMLAHELKVKCTDCGYYPYERGNGKLNLGDGIEIQELTPDVERRLFGRDVVWDFYVEDLLGGSGVRVSQRCHGPVQTACPPDQLYMNGEAVQKHVKKLAGRVLTLIDAVMTGTQGNAFKTLIRREFRSELSLIGDFFYGPRAVQTEEEVVQEL